MLVAEMGSCFNPDATRLPDGSYKNTKWSRSSFFSAKSGPGPVFVQPKVDPVRVELSETKVSTIVKLALLHAQIAFSR